LIDAGATRGESRSQSFKRPIIQEELTMRSLPQALLITATLLLTVSSSAVAEDTKNEKTAKQKFPVVWEVTDGIQAPESAYYDAKSGSLFLSQIGAGGGKKKDGDGWISKLTIDGKVVKNKWVTGFNAPKGLRSYGGKLWISDIDRVICVDIAAAKIDKVYEIKEAKFLNDLACGSDGTVYVSDMAASRVYQIQKGKVSVFAEGEDLEHPNGLLAHGGKLYLGGWGRELQADFSTNIPGRLIEIDIVTKKLKVISSKPTGNLDGVEVDGKGGFVVTDWRAGKVLHIDAKGDATVLMELPRGSADHAYLADRHLLILPRMLENKLTAFDLSTALK
jgi:sugar lactone lactonase YvrE